MEEAFLKSLFDLASAIIKILQSHGKENQIHFFDRVYFKYNFELFEYDNGVKRCSYSKDFFTKKEWYLIEQSIFIEKNIEPIEEFKNSFRLLSHRNKMNEGAVTHNLQLFCLSIIKDYPQIPTESLIAKNISTFVKDLDGETNNIETEVWLDGISTESETEICDFVLLRPPIKHDFEKEHPVDELIGSIKSSKLHFPKSILKITTRGIGYKNSHSKLAELLSLFRLYKLGSVIDINYFSTNDSIINKSYNYKNNTNNSSHYSYSLAKQEFRLFHDFIDRLLSPIASIYSNSLSSNNFILLSIGHFEEALIKFSSYERSIASAISSLETLLFKDNEESELSHRLSQRMAVMLRVYGFPPIEVYNKLVTAYRIRSKYVHGSPIDDKEKESIHLLTQTILNYTRIIIVIMVQLFNKIEKDSLISKIDNSLLDEKANDRLKSVLSELIVPIS